MAIIAHPDGPSWDSNNYQQWPECECDCQECFYERDEAIHPDCKYQCGLGDAEMPETSWIMEDLGDNRSISRSYGGCATCDGGGCPECRESLPS